MEDILIILALVLYFLLGCNTDRRKYIKATRAAISYELKLTTSDYRKGWLDCLYFILNGNGKDRWIETAEGEISELISEYNFEVTVLESISYRLSCYGDEAYAKQQLRYLKNQIIMGFATEKRK